MKAVTRITFCDDNDEKFFGEGPCRLLHAIEQTGSLRAAAQSMQMAYTKALGLVRHAEQVLGFALTERKIGGKGGGVVVKRHAEQVALFPVKHPAELMDADTPDVLAELKTIFQNDSFYR